MRNRSQLRKWVLVIWACVLAFGISYQLAEAESLHSSCRQACKVGCGATNCASYVQNGCTCHFLCKDGGTGESQCVL